jgi:hypothetical protein
LAYPTGTEWRAVSSVIGAQPIGATESAARHTIGMRTRAHDHTYGDAEFVYLLGVADTAAGDLVSYDPKSGVTERALRGKRGPLAVAVSACTAGLYGWYAVEGSVPLATELSVVSLGTVYLSDTAGEVRGIPTDGQRIDGLAVRALPSGGFATAALQQPSANGGDLTADFKRGTP